MTPPPSFVSLLLAGLSGITNKEPGAGLGPAEAGQSNYHQVQDNLYRITDHNTRGTGHEGHQSDSIISLRVIAWILIVNGLTKHQHFGVLS